MSRGRALLAWVERQVDACRPVALRYFRSSGLAVRRKADGSPVTAADRAIEERLRRALARAHPGERIVGEEYGDSGRGDTTYWTIDPIDGTRAFSRGLPSWGIMVGRVERGVPVLGVVDFPAMGTRLVVAPGVPPAERRGRRLVRLPRAAAAPPLADAVLFHGGTRYWARTPYHAGFARLLTTCYLERAYGDCWGFLLAFRGGADAVLEYGVKPWDLVPLAAAARATGWAFGDCAGRPNFLGPELVMAKPGLLPTLTRALRGGRR